VFWVVGMCFIVLMYMGGMLGSIANVYIGTAVCWLASFIFKETSLTATCLVGTALSIWEGGDVLSRYWRVQMGNIKKLICFPCQRVANPYLEEKNEKIFIVGHHIGHDIHSMHITANAQTPPSNLLFPASVFISLRMTSSPNPCTDISTCDIMLKSRLWSLDVSYFYIY
jgi:hypothetical protein